MSRNIHSNQAGIAHFGLILVVIIFVAVGSLVYWRFQSADNSEVSIPSNASDEEKLQKELHNSLSEVEESENQTDVQQGGVENE
jgi:ligand-binding sensor protein